MKKLPRILTRFFLFLFPLLLLSGCGNTGKLNEGECKGVVAFTDIPKTFFMLDEELQKQFEIRVTLENITTEKRYRITLNQENDYKQELSLHPGVYRVMTAHAKDSDNIGLTVTASAESMTFTTDQEARLDILVKDVDAFTEHWMEMQPLPEIRLAEMYSGMIQINRKIISLKDIVPELDFSNEKTLNPYEKADFEDSRMGITVTLQNKTDSALFFEDCEVIGIKVTKNTVIFPEGVTIGTATSSVCHQKDGIYGEPTSFKGAALFGMGIDESYAVYVDSNTGNRITFGFDGSGEHIASMQYELGVFE